MENTDLFSLAKIFMNFMIEDSEHRWSEKQEMNMENLMEGIEIAKLGRICICCQI